MQNMDPNMDPTWSAALWRQFGAAIDMLDNALVACPDALWQESLWSDRPDPIPPPYGEFWSVAYHALYWLDLYLLPFSDSLLQTTPPAPFPAPAEDADDELPEQPYTKDELRAYLAYTRRNCHSAVAALRAERARGPYEFPWEKGQGRPISNLELLMYTMRHVQEHAAQLSLFLGQHGIPDADLDWVSRAREDA